MQFHWKVLAWMLAGVLVGLGMQWTLEAPAWSGASFEASASGTGLELVGASGPAARAKELSVGDVVTHAVIGRGREDERRSALSTPEDFAGFLADSENGQLLWLELEGAEKPASMTLVMDPSSARARWLRPFEFIAGLFMRLLRMLIVPLVLCSIVSGVAGVGGMGDLKRLGGKTFAYYITTSVLAIFLGQVLVNLIGPGRNAQLGLSPLEEEDYSSDDSFIGVIERMIPENVFEAMTSNSSMLAIIFFALMLGVFITRTDEPHRGTLRGLFESGFQVMLRMAEGVLTLLPYGVFALMVRVVAKTGFAVFAPLGLYMITVLAALVLHAVMTLPLMLHFVGKLSPRRWFNAMAPALMTAFSTSSSSMTLPVTMETVEKRGKVSPRVTSFTLPLGSTINMDGTALYECIGVIFLAQYYATTGGEFDLTLGKQALVVIMALTASIGAAGIPSAGLVMMLTILSTLGLPLEGAALILAVDRPLDMLRTVVNVWSDSCGAAVIARSEGEVGPLSAGDG